MSGATEVALLLTRPNFNTEKTYNYKGLPFVNWRAGILPMIIGVSLLVLSWHRTGTRYSYIRSESQLAVKGLDGVLDRKDSLFITNGCNRNHGNNHGYVTMARNHGNKKWGSVPEFLFTNLTKTGSQWAGSPTAASILIIMDMRIS